MSPTPALAAEFLTSAFWANQATMQGVALLVSVRPTEVEERMILSSFVSQHWFLAMDASAFTYGFEPEKQNSMRIQPGG